MTLIKPPEDKVVRYYNEADYALIPYHPDLAPAIRNLTEEGEDQLPVTVVRENKELFFKVPVEHYDKCRPVFRAYYGAGNLRPVWKRREFQS